MKKTEKWMISVTLAIFATALLSWDQHNNSSQAATAFFANASTQNDDETNLVSYTGNDWFGSPYESNKLAPPAEDVLIQKIQGDNNHLLMMAFYSKENYSGQFVSIENGGHLVFRDDGKGHDRKAGDGLYTAKVTVDVNEFRQKALNTTAQMNKKGYKPVRFDHRAMIADPDADENFDMQKWERGETVSISGLTNALSDLDLFDNTVSGNSGGTISNLNHFNNSVASSVSVDAVSVKLNSIRTNCVTITNLAVVEDPTRTWNACTQTGNVDGPWTFKTIMKHLASTNPSNLATDVQVSDFVKSWLGNFATDQIINGDTVKARTSVNNKILSPWLTKSQNAGAP